VIKVGVVGMGFMGRTHVAAYQAAAASGLPCELAAVCDPNPARLTGKPEGGGNLGAASEAPLFDASKVRGFTDFDDLLASDVSLISICTYTDSHVDYAARSLKAGKHVLVEKPVALHSQDVGRLCEAAVLARTHCVPAMCMRFWPGWDWLRAQVALGDDCPHGRVRAARFRRVGEPPAWGRDVYLDGAASGGALLDLHIHDVDFVQHLFGRPKSVYAQGVGFHSGAIDHVVAQYTVANGAAVSAEGSWAMATGHGFNMAYTVVFERATADYDLARGAEALKVFEPGRGGRVVTPEPGDGYVGELGYMAECIEKGRAPRRVTAEDGVSAVEICEAEEESIRTGRPVPLK